MTQLTSMSAPMSADGVGTCDAPSTFVADAAPFVRTLVGDPTGLEAAWEAYRATVEAPDATLFATAVTDVVGTACEVCSDCGSPAWEDDGDYADDDFVCVDCERRCQRCDGCQDLYRDHRSMTFVGASVYCTPCRDSRCSRCDYCDEWYHDDDRELHSHDCDCEAPHPRFRFPAAGPLTVENDDRLLVELAIGTIDPRGIDEIVEKLWSDLRPQLARFDWREDVARSVVALDPRWQTRRGNFTRRLSSALYERHGIKLAPPLISQIGNIARLHSSGSCMWFLEFTRDLNQPPEAFYNGASCWWDEYAASRCALKSWGGLAMRSYAASEDPADEPAGRAWVQPLNGALQPTHDAAGAHAYLVYNCYGNLEGYTAARLVAHLASRTYRKVACSLEGQWVNDDAGYLVADQATCERVTQLSVTHGGHDLLDADRLAPVAA